MKKGMRIIDMHCDTLMELWRHPEKSWYDGDTSINLRLMQEAGSLCQCFAMYIPRRELKSVTGYGIMRDMYRTYRQKMKDNADRIRPAYTADDIIKNSEAGYLSSLLTIEDAVCVEDSTDRIQEAYEMGVRMIGLIWNYENRLAYPNSRDREIHMRGLKKFGIEAVEKMNELGIVPDCSHLNEGGFYDVARYARGPFACTHSCARALCDHPRNLTDDQLKVLGEKGGIVGVNFYGSFLFEGGGSPTIDRIIEHLRYMVDKAGIEHVGFGSDLDGIEDNGEIVDYGGFARLLERMEESFTDDEIDKISHGNFLRVLREVQGKQ